VGAVGSCCCWATQASKSAGSWAITLSRMLAWEMPHISAHCPRYSPGSSASMVQVWVRPGTTSRLPLRRGDQNEWITSTDSRVRKTGVPVGMCSSLAVTMPSSSYSNCHQNWAPTTWTFIASEGRSLSVKIVATVGTAMTARMTAGRMVQPISSRVLPCTWRGTSSSSGPRRRNLTTATMMAASTRTKTTTATQNTGTKRLWIIRELGPAGSRASCGASAAQPVATRTSPASSSNHVRGDRLRLRRVIHELPTAPLSAEATAGWSRRGWAVACRIGTPGAKFPGGGGTVGAMWRFLRSPAWLAAHVVVLALVALMVHLGLWQWDRHQERREVNAAVAARSAEAPVGPAELAAAGADPSGLEFRGAVLRGTWAPEEEVLVRPRSHEGRPGFHVLTPLVLDDGSAVLVNRGWVPLQADADRPRTGEAVPDGPVEVEGRVRLAEARQGIGPRDPGEGRLEQLSRVDVERLARQMPFALAPVYVELVRQSPPTPGDLPVAVPAPEPGSGPHLSYAGQWFIFATIAAVGWPVLLHRTARRRPEAEEGPGDGPEPGPVRSRRRRAPDPLAGITGNGHHP
jgi:surfeit locus 1 family protein